MFNKELKEQYLYDDKTNKTLLRFMPHLFEVVGKYEDEYQKDLCNFTIQEIENFFLSLSTSSYNRCQNIKSQFIKYSRYCQERGLVDDNQIHWLEVDSDFLKRTINIGKFRDELVTREQLLKDIQMLPNASEAFLVLAIFEGVCGNLYRDFYHMTIDQFERQGNKVILYLMDRELEVSEKLYELAQESVNCYERLPHSPDAKRIMKLHTEDPWIIKRAIISTVDTKESHFHTIANRIGSIREDYDLPYCTQAGLLNSGRIDYLVQLSNGNEVVVEDVKNNYNDLTERYGRIQVMSDIILQYKELYNKGE